MKRLSFYLFLCAVLLMSVNVFGQFSGGQGAFADPYPNAEAEGLSGQALADSLNTGLDSVAFVASRLSASPSKKPLKPNDTGIYRSKKSGSLFEGGNWEVTPSDTKQFIISAGHTITLGKPDIQVISGASIIVEDGGTFVKNVDDDISGANITIRDGGNFINKKMAMLLQQWKRTSQAVSGTSLVSLFKTRQTPAMV